MSDVKIAHSLFNTLCLQHNLSWSYTYTGDGVIIHLHDKSDRLIHSGTVPNTIGFFLGMKYALGEL